MPRAPDRRSSSKPPPRKKRVKPSFAVAAKKFIGSIDFGPGDLATNPKHMKGFVQTSREKGFGR